MAHAYNPSTLGGLGRWIARTSGAEVAVSRDCTKTLQPGGQGETLSQVYIYVHACVYMDKCVYMYAYVYMHVYVCICVYMYAYDCVYVCVCVRTYVCM